jgi:hypothetical protein
VAVAKSAVLEVEVTLTVRAQLEADGATTAELRRFVEREQEAVAATVAKVATGRRLREAGWLDEDRSAFVTEIIEAEHAKTEHERGMHSDVVAVVR